MNDTFRNKKPERILVFPFDLMSHYLRCLELVKQYPHAEIFFASSVKYNPFVIKAGHKIFAVEGFDSTEVMACAERFDFSWLNQNVIERVFLSQVKAIRMLCPDRVIGDTAPTLKMAAEYTQVSYAALMNGYMSPYYSSNRGLPLRHPGRKYLSVFGPVIRKRIVKFAESLAFRRVHKPFRRLRSAYGLKPVLNYLREMQGDFNLICDERWFFRQKKLPANYEVVGALLYEACEEEDDLIQAIPVSKKLILVCMGSSGNWEALRFLSSPKYKEYLVLTAGDAKQVIKGEHVISRPFVSLGSVLPKCDLLICHGGNGTVYHGIKHKVPILCLTSHFEQEWNAQRLEELKLGKHINSGPEAFVDEFLNRFKSSEDRLASRETHSRKLNESNYGETSLLY
ncbi:MAG TPA: hypothetical protein PLQ93_07830 [Bacteroidia bacterium]|nr:hypothetical protein [Bacteroidia bacterium]